VRHVIGLVTILSLGSAPAAAVESAPQVAFKQLPGDRQAIVRLDQTGEGAVELTRGKPRPSEFGAFSWSPDGSRLVYASDGVVGGDLYSLGADGGDVVRLTAQGNNDDPAWSSAGTQIAYVHTERVRLPSGLFRLDEDIWLVARDGSLRRLTTDAGQRFELEWSPDGSSIVFSRLAPGGGLTISVVEAASGRVLLRTAGFGGTWSPDGSRLAVQNGERLEVLRADGTGRRTVAVGGVDPDWAPDGLRIAFSRSRCVDVFRGICSNLLKSVFTVAADGGGERRLTGPISGGPGSAFNGVPNDDSGEPRWWPDGSRIFFTRAGKAHVMNADGTCERPFGPQTLFLESPRWRPGAPPNLPPLQCVDLRVRGGALRRVYGKRERARIQVVVENDGTKTATGIRLVVRRAFGRGRFVPAGPCRGVGVLSCDLAPLEPGRNTMLTIGVTSLRPPQLQLHARVTATEHPTARAWPIYVSVLDCDVLGTSKADRLVGTRRRDKICALAGNDQIRARDGRRDVIDCGPGQDRVRADRLDVTRNCERVFR
jgi:hypothetical protein